MPGETEKKLHEMCDEVGDMPKEAYLDKQGPSWYCNNCDLNSGIIKDKVVPYIEGQLDQGIEQYCCGEEGKCPYTKALISFRLNE